MKSKSILFDMDGVLVDSLNSWFFLFNSTLKNFGLEEIDENEFREQVWGGPIEKDVMNYFKKQSIDEVAGYYLSNFSKFQNHLKIFPDTKRVLGALKENSLRVGLVTNTFSMATKEILAHFSLIDYFDAIVSGDDVKKGKPEPDLMIEACRRMKVPVKETILVGDTKNDIIAGRRAGCFTIGFKIDGDARIENLYEVLKFVDIATK